MLHTRQGGGGGGGSMENENIARNDKQDVTFPTVTHRQPALQSARRIEPLAASANTAVTTATIRLRFDGRSTAYQRRGRFMLSLVHQCMSGLVLDLV